MAHAFSESEKVDKVYVTPGNGGVYEYGGEQVPLQEDTREERILEIIEKAEELDTDLAVPGPEGWISAGIVDEFRSRSDVPIVGPTRDVAFLETSKCDAKDYLKSIGVRVPIYENFEDPEEAKEWAKQFYQENPDKNLVPKADGIAAGKGAFVCGSLQETLTAIDKISSEEFNEKFDDAGRRIEVEERLDGREISYFAITDGEEVRFFGTARDYKRRFPDSDHFFVDRYFDGINPNTGGMGSYSPEEMGEKLKDKIMEEIAEPTVENLKGEYQGVLHFVLMATKEDGEYKPHVLEINVRDGDPEAQSRLPRLESDMYEIYKSVSNRELDRADITWSPEYCVAVCVVSGRPWSDGKPVEGHAGYPGEYYSKQPIFLKGERKERIGKEGIGEYVNGFVYHNGTDFHQGYLRTRGGRVLTFVNKGKNLAEAKERTYSDIEDGDGGGIHFSFMDFRKDVGEEEGSI
ncbi:hypothetical protein AKJ65_06690 [candidate division MSBL1 archaeon SCGC-AAA259E19]|uniref:phosphoribosylamine--glycine ligase n=1 Tax=candidate division MSBL1 archaeon SCGC-AAA259E19 TaxID=1698264 RepID=A0A133UFT9_9EURY|nr:hypothetical protein AKJ65_06690 [candidate division MSBL1 archaeon SCGC-AAA259E19]